MSEEPRITIEKKEKDPKKVAGGRKLAAISKAAKNSKRGSEEASSRTKSREDKSQDYGDYTNFNYFSIPIIATFGVAVGIGYYLYLSKSTTPPAPPVPSQKTNLIYL